ncbi:MAG: histidinol-phosphate transaminase [Chloroflexi bacterium]|nr:histidinol-phosphate transaminase [Chloroflexota bacterium]
MPPRQGSEWRTRVSFEIDAYLRPHILKMPAYEPILPYDVVSQELNIPMEGIVKLDANENPYGPLPEVPERLAALGNLHIYPDPESRRVRDMLADYHQISTDNIVIGAGADELIDLIMRLVIDPGDVLINCPPTFGMYAFDGTLNNARVLNVPRLLNYSLELDGIAQAVIDFRPKLIYLATPNNPDGSLLSRETIEALLALPLLVVLDEAYINFSKQPEGWIQEVENYQNLIVLRTFSKWAGLAGLRIGYGVFPTNFVPRLMAAKQPYNISVVAEEAACTTLRTIHKVDRMTELIIAERGRLQDRLQAISWLEPYPSQANFILCRVLDRDAATVKMKLREQGILIRHFNTPGLTDHIRVSIGKPGDSDRLISALIKME